MTSSYGVIDYVTRRGCIKNKQVSQILRESLHLPTLRLHTVNLDTQFGMRCWFSDDQAYSHEQAYNYVTVL